VPGRDLPEWHLRRTLTHFADWQRHLLGVQMTDSILAFLRANGEQLDVDMAASLDIPIAELRDEVARLASSGDLICCRVTRFIDGRKIEGTSCRLSCDPPTPARGRKPGVKKVDDSKVDDNSETNNY
jgi:hypothetical protein